MLDGNIVGFVGGGNMAAAIIGGLLASHSASNTPLDVLIGGLRVRSEGVGIVTVQLIGLVLREVAVGVNARSVLHLILSVGGANPVARGFQALKGDEGLIAPEKAGLDSHPCRLTRGIIEVNLTDLANLVTRLVNNGAVVKSVNISVRRHLVGWHSWFLSF